MVTYFTPQKKKMRGADSDAGMVDTNIPAGHHHHIVVHMTSVGCKLACPTLRVMCDRVRGHVVDADV